MCDRSFIVDPLSYILFSPVLYNWENMALYILICVNSMSMYIILFNTWFTNLIVLNIKGMEEGNVLFNDALNTFYLVLYDIRHYGKGPLR